MKVEIFSICDFASCDSGGKMNIIGVFNTVAAREKPIIYGLCAVALRIRFEKVEEGPKKIKLTFVDADGSPIMPVIEPQFNVQFPPMASTANAQIVTIIQQIRFPSFGEYSLDLAIDGRQEASTPFYVHQIPILPPQFQTPLPLG